MIINKNIHPDLFSCKRIIMEYLTFKCYIPLFSFSGNVYYFVKNEKLEKALKNMPLYLKVLNRFGR